MAKKCFELYQDLTIVEYLSVSLFYERFKTPLWSGGGGGGGGWGGRVSGGGGGIEGSLKALALGCVDL